MDRHHPHDPQVLLSHLGWLRMLARQLVRDQHLAEDLAQDTCVVALQGHPADPTRVRGWLSGILENLALKRTRHEAHRSHREQVGHVRERNEAAGALVERVEAQGELVRLVLELDEPLRDVVLMHYFEEQPLSRIAQELGLTYATVFRRLQRAHERLRGRLERSLGKDPGLWSMVLLGLPLKPESTVLAQSGGLLVGSKLAVASTVAVAGGAVLAVLALREWGRADSAPATAAEPIVAAAGLAPGTAAAEQDAASRTPMDGQQAAAQPVSEVLAVEPSDLLALERGHERLRTAMEDTLRGAVDVGAFLDIGLAVVELEPEPTQALPRPELDGSVRRPLANAPPGLEASLKVDVSRNPAYGSELCSLRVRLAPPQGASMALEGSARRAPETELTAFTDRHGALLALGIVTEFQVSSRDNRALGIPTAQARIPLSFSFSYDVRDPLASSARMTWLDGDVRSESYVDWRLVGRQPAVEDLERFSARLQELLAGLR